MTDYTELKRLAEACGDLNWRAIQENWCEWAIRDDHGYIATMRTKSAKHPGPCPDREAKAKFLCVVTPAAVLALIAENEQLAKTADCWDRLNIQNKALSDSFRNERDQLRAEVAGLRTGYEAYERVNAELKAEVEGLRQIISDSATSCGAAVSVECTLEFMGHLPGEIFSVISKLRNALAECADSLHGEMLQKFGGQLPDDMHPVTRREYDRDMAEVAGYRAALGQGEQS